MDGIQTNSFCLHLYRRTRITRAYHVDFVLPRLEQTLLGNLLLMHLFVVALLSFCSLSYSSLKNSF